MAFALVPALVKADIAVIVNAENPAAALSVQTVSDVYLGNNKQFDGLADAIVLTDLPEGDAVREKFYPQVTNKSAKKAKKHWVKQVFSGQGVPPKQFNSGAEVVDFVSLNRTAIGYVDAADVNDRVKIVMVMK